MIKSKAMEEWFKKNRFVLLLAVLFLACFFRLYNLPSAPPALFTDEAVNAKNAYEAITSGDYKVFYKDNNGREGLFINIQALSVATFGNKPWALRLPSAIFGILTVLGTYFLAREMFKKESLALFASFFLSITFWHVNFSRMGFRAIMAPFFLVWGFYLVWKLVTWDSLGDPISKWTLRVLPFVAGLVFGLGFHSYIAYRAAPALLLFPFIVLIKNKCTWSKKIWISLFFILGMVIAILPLAIYFQQNPGDFFGRTSQISIFSLPNPIFELVKNTIITAGMFFVAGDFNWRHNYAGAPELFAPVAILFLIGIILSLKRVFKSIFPLNMAYLSMLFWFGLMLLPVVVSSEGLPHALRAIIIIPVCMIFAAIGLDWLIEKFYGQHKRIVKYSLVALVVVCIIFSFNLYFTKWANNPETDKAFNKNLLDTSNYLNSLPKEMPKYVIMETNQWGPPMSMDVVMFLTKTLLPEWQKEKNIFYVPKSEEVNLPAGSIKVWID